MTLLEGGSGAELLCRCFCLCHKAAWVSSAGGSVPSLSHPAVLFLFREMDCNGGDVL